MGRRADNFKMIIFVSLVFTALVHSLETDDGETFEEILQGNLTNEIFSEIAGGNENQLVPNTLLPRRFPCTIIPPSSSVPTSVHALRPGDIKVIGAMGDSFTAGTSSTGEGFIDEALVFRGFSFSAGGSANFRRAITLPNILKLYNPDLYGYSQGIGMSRTRLNKAIPGSTTLDILDQAQKLISDLKTDPNIDIDNDWKVITIFIGVNDLCQSCIGDFTPISYSRRIKETLDLLKDQVPRTFVNLVSLFHFEHNRYLLTNSFSNFGYRLLCSCVAFPISEPAYDQIVKHRRGYVNAIEELVRTGRYDRSDSFTVVVQPFFKDSSHPRRPLGTIDYSFYALDELHFSKKGYEAAAVYLWNSMFEPVGSKTTAVNWRSDRNVFKCPTEHGTLSLIILNSILETVMEFDVTGTGKKRDVLKSSPFLRTKRNS